MLEARVGHARRQSIDLKTETRETENDQIILVVLPPRTNLGFELRHCGANAHDAQELPSVPVVHPNLLHKTFRYPEVDGR